MPTKQETYDVIVAGLRSQGRKSEDDCGLCMYRAPDGCKCAAGWVIPDDEYRPVMEKLCVESVYVRPVLQKLGHDFKLVRDMQTIHDQIKVEKWESKFEEVARKHKLTYTPLK